jgi:hypothetical protein
MERKENPPVAQPNLHEPEAQTAGSDTSSGGNETSHWTDGLSEAIGVVSSHSAVS